MEGREGFIDEKLRMQSYHLYVGELESLSLSLSHTHTHTHTLSLSLSLFIYLFILKKHVDVQVVVIVAHIFPWFYVQERLKRPLWVRDGLPIQFFF